MRPRTDMNKIYGITLVTALGIAKVLEEACGTPVKVKWPNDIFVNSKKVSGMLIEVKAQPDKVDFLILGIGVNVNTPANKLPDNATALKIEAGKEFSKISIFRRIVEELERSYDKMMRSGFDAFRGEIKKRLFGMGGNVSVLISGKKKSVMIMDIDDIGALIVKEEDGQLRRLLSGDLEIE
ncbi:MAG: biotin--[acetyl-CoA-carboxylase] ligase [Candidatus Omnitrophica bacterium]|nr:biotin--[acetyl-CoA-carboxylase] ligase [Candidatus Omnitrophota bacterium]